MSAKYEDPVRYQYKGSFNRQRSLKSISKFFHFHKKYGNPEDTLGVNVRINTTRQRNEGSETTTETRKMLGENLLHWYKGTKSRRENVLSSKIGRPKEN